MLVLVCEFMCTLVDACVCVEGGKGHRGNKGWCACIYKAWEVCVHLQGIDKAWAKLCTACAELSALFVCRYMCVCACV